MTHDRNAPMSPEDWRDIGKSRREIALSRETEAERSLRESREEDEAVEQDSAQKNVQ